MTANATYTIRRADVSDADVLSAIGGETFAEAFGDLYSAEDLAAFLESDHSVDACAQLLVDNRYAAWIAEDETGDAIGYAVAGPCGLPVENMPPKAGELKRVYILKRAQGAGLGTRLIDCTLRWMADNAYAPVYLSVYQHNYDAHRLYARNGFKKIQEYEFKVGSQLDPEFIFELEGQRS